MRILELNATDEAGGAAKAAFRLHMGLRQLNVESRMIVLKKTGNNDEVSQIPGYLGDVVRGLNWRFDSLPLHLYPKRKFASVWSLNWIPFPVGKFILNAPADLYHLHWIGSGFIPLGLLGRLDKPVLWTLHDSWAFTGGCHLPFDCMGYRQNCGACPQLGSVQSNDISRWTIQRKQRVYEKMQLTIVTPSRWLAEKARESNLLRDKRIEVIPNGLDLKIFRPIDKKQARNLLQLPQDKKLILTGAVNVTNDLNKGYHLLIPALQKLAMEQGHDELELIVIGADAPAQSVPLNLKTHFMGVISDENTLAAIYSAADTFVLPSLQETLPNMIMEALACGMPCVAFDIGGIPDMIEHQRNGYLARPYSVDDLAQGIAWVLEDDQRYTQLSTRARQKVETEFELGKISGKYRDLYEEILMPHPSDQH